MPSPVGHALAGLSVHLATARDERDWRSAGRLGLLVGAALAPDLDLLLNVATGRNYHQAQSHSIGFAALAGLVVWSLARLTGAASARRLGALVALAWLTHVALDYLSVDTSPPIGLMAAWPLAAGWYKCPWPVFLDIGRNLDWSTMRHNALAVALEATLLLPPTLWYWSRRPRGTR